MSDLDKALSIAIHAHQGQKDRYGKEAILHPLRVMMRMKTAEEKITAILHDVVEDSNWTIDGLKDEGFSGVIVEAVDCLSKHEGEPYTEYIERVKQSSLAVAVKMGDLEDNMNMQRVTREMTHKDLERFTRYHKARSDLKKLL
jgi:(p)ppGpp synthase/HD superfamily hydrolase